MRNMKTIVAVSVVAGLLVASLVAYGNVSKQGGITLNVTEPHILQYRLYNTGTPAFNRTNTYLETENESAAFFVRCQHNLGLASLRQLDVYMYYDFGVDPVAPGVGYNSTQGENYNFHMRYVFGGGAFQQMYPLPQVPAYTGEFEVRSDFSNPIDANTVDLTLEFNLTAWTRWAPLPTKTVPGVGNSYTVAAFNDIKSFNFEIVLTDVYGNVDGRFDEFGIYKREVMGLHGPALVGGGAPGQDDVILTAQTLDSQQRNEFMSNAPHKLTVSMDNNLVGPGVIPVINVSFFAGGAVAGVDDWSRAIFPAIGTDLYIMGNVTDYRVLSDFGYAGLQWNSTVTFTTAPVWYIHTPGYTWWVNIPFGVAEGTYTTTMTFDLATAPVVDSDLGIPYGTPLP